MNTGTYNIFLRPLVQFVFADEGAMTTQQKRENLKGLSTNFEFFSILMLVAVLLQLTPSGDAHAGSFWDCDSSSLTSFWEQDVGGNELKGKGTVCVTPFGLWSSIAV